MRAFHTPSSLKNNIPSECRSENSGIKSGDRGGNTHYIREKVRMEQEYCTGGLGRGKDAFETTMRDRINTAEDTCLRASTC